MIRLAKIYSSIDSGSSLSATNNFLPLLSTIFDKSVKHPLYQLEGNLDQYTNNLIVVNNEKKAVIMVHLYQIQIKYNKIFLIKART
jgi:hypothetical protein